MLNLFKIISFLFVFAKSESAKILGVFPTPSISHQVVFRPLMLELARRGHEVTVITPNPVFPRNQTPANFTEIDVHDISYAYIRKLLTVDVHYEDNPLALMKSMSEFYLEVVKIQLESPEVQEVIKNNKHFDLLFIESCARPALIFSHIFKAPVIEISSLGGVFTTNENIGAAAHPIIYPEPTHRRIFNLTIWEKLKAIYIHYASDRIYLDNIDSENEMLKTILGPDTTDLRDLKKNVHMLFVNIYPIWDFNRPVPPNVIYLGGIHQNPKQELPKDLRHYLDSSKNGVIYMSFGSNIMPSMLPKETIKIFINVFSKLPYDVLWKWDKEELPGRPHNVKISKWLPQSDLLKHPKVKLFITQGGLQSTDEALIAAVPLIGIPVHGDQWFNVEHYVKFNIGVQLSLKTLTEDEFMHAINISYDNKRFRENIVKLRNLMDDQPHTPLDRAVWWTEYVLRHGGAEHLRSPAAGMTWSEYYELNLALIVLSILVIYFLSVIIAIKFIVSKMKFYMSSKVKIS